LTVSTGELEERRPLGEREQALRFGAEFGLGELEHVSRRRNVPKYAGGAAIFGFIVLINGLPVTIGISGGPYTATSKLITDLVFALLFAACAVSFGVGMARSTVTRRLYRYSGGLAELVDGQPEPSVARWADIAEFTVDYFESDESLPRISGFALKTDTGTRLSSISGQVRRQELRTLVAEAEKNLRPRLMPAMTEAYESGAPVAFGRVKVSKEGITLQAWPPPGEVIPWSRVKSVHLTYIDRKNGDYVKEIIVGRKDGPTEEVGVGGLPNGIFLPGLIVYAAREVGLMVTGYRADGGGIPDA
jgi:hypothetical protein